MPKVSVIVPVYNSRKYAARAMESALDQTFADIEIIVIDDGSTDGTGEIISKYISGFPDKVRYFYQENGGVSRARNVGIEKAAGDYIAFLDSDDAWLPEKVEEQLEFMSAHPEYVMCFCDQRLVVKDRVKYQSMIKERPYRHAGSGQIFRNLLNECFIFPSTVLLKRGCLKQAGVFNETYMAAEDAELWLRIARRFQIGFLDRVLTVRYVHENNITGEFELTKEHAVRLFQEQLEQDTFDSDTLKVIRQRLSERYFWWAHFLWESDQLPAARVDFINAMRYDLRKCVRTLPYIMACSLPPGFKAVTLFLKRTLRLGKGHTA